MKCLYCILWIFLTKLVYIDISQIEVVNIWRFQINPLHIVWQYIVMLISYDFQNIVEISLSHFFLTISHDIYLISTHTESSYRWLKVPTGEAIFSWKWHKKSKYTPHKWSLTGKDRFPKKIIIYAFFANCRESPEHAFREKTQFLTLLKYRVYRVIIVSKPKISCNIVWTLKKRYRRAID